MPLPIPARGRHDRTGSRALAGSTTCWRASPATLPDAASPTSWQSPTSSSCRARSAIASSTAATRSARRPGDGPAIRGFTLSYPAAVTAMDRIVLAVAASFDPFPSAAPDQASAPQTAAIPAPLVQPPVPARSAGRTGRSDRARSCADAVRPEDAAGRRRWTACQPRGSGRIATPAWPSWHSRAIAMPLR